MILGAMFGLLTVATLLSQVGRVAHAEREKDVALRSGCSVSVLILATSRVVLARAIDRSTGGTGFSHVAWDACEEIDGVAVGIDCRPGKGVHRRPLAEIIDGREFVRVVLPLAEGREAYGCARARVGESYDGLAPFTTYAGGRRRGTICSELVYECLPARIRAMVNFPPNRPVAPNDIAAAFGVTSPKSPTIIIGSQT